MRTPADNIPRIKHHMTPFPYSIAAARGLDEAEAMMDEHDIRHLPVTRADALHGLLYRAELRVATELGADGRAITVGDVCTRDPLIVDLNTPLADVADIMVERRVSAALVTRADKLVGILTSTDVCRLLGELLRGPPDEVA
ncbi:MAG: CBS domain-containing protein [Myxococcales bacterium]|nr:CBS domain-containing protein [Myxococcales bacterium]MCB9753177.1 CBS domain-containing protein [Myxococcales bacterium]